VVGDQLLDPSIASADWIMVGVLVLVMIPFIVILGLRYARPLSSQFSRLREAADNVTQGQFGSQAELIKDAPAEMIRFAIDFNGMTQQLALYANCALRMSRWRMNFVLR
jgi:nitrogen fixation/metabolism regulation signal transduction histidine kinase